MVMALRHRFARGSDGYRLGCAESEEPENPRKMSRGSCLCRAQVFHRMLSGKLLLKVSLLVHVYTLTSGLKLWK